MIQALKMLVICSAVSALLFLLHSHAISAHASCDVPHRTQYFVTATPPAADVPAIATTQPSTAQATAQAPAALRDGAHDFDFEIGSWKIHLKKLMNPLTGSTTWVEFDGTSVTRKIWDGRSQIEEFETDSPTSGHIEGLTLRLYNPTAHQWNLNWATSKSGAFGVPTIGEFKNGRGEFYDWEPINDRMVLVRFVWSDITPTTAHFEQAFSTDGGKTWEVNWITDQTRVKE
jgi:hypothetical protein